MKKFLLSSTAVIVLLLSSVSVYSQRTESIITSLPARQVGFGADGYRISALAVYEKNPSVFIYASGNGGVVKTWDGGKTYRFIFDKQGSSNIGALAISQKDSNIIWVGTGEGWQRNSVGRGDGIYKSADGGKTWKHMGLPNSMSFSRITIHPVNDNIVFAAVLGSPWGYGPDRGIYKTADGGVTWKKVLYVDEKSAGTDVIIDPKNPQNMLAALWDHIHRPYGWFESGPGSGIFKSTDGGETWHKVMQGLPKKNVGRIALDYFLKDPKQVVAAIEATSPSTGIYRSADGGETWREMPAVHYKDGVVNTSNVWFRPFYNQIVKFSTGDSNIIYHGNKEHVSKDGGKTFVGADADDHVLWIDPENPDHGIWGGDKNLHQSWQFNTTFAEDKTWMKINVPVFDQLYGIGYDMRKLYHVVGQSQDGGSCYYVGTQSPRYSVTSNDVIILTGDERGKAMADPTDWTKVYAMGLDGPCRNNLKTGTFESLFTTFSPGYARDDDYERYKKMNPKVRLGWHAPWSFSPADPATIYFGKNFLYQTTDAGATWKTISPDLTHNKPEWQVPDGTVYRNNENSMSRAYQTITAVQESSLQRDLIWVGTDDGYVHLSINGGKSWKNLTKNIKGIPEYCWVSSITPSRYAPGRAYVTFDNHRHFDLHTYVFLTEDYGQTWTKINGNLPEQEACLVIKEGLKNPDLLYLGTEFSLWISLDRGKTWARYQDWKLNDYPGYFGATSGYLPSVEVHDIEIHPRELDLILATHGRGAWIIPCRALEELTSENLAKEIYLVTPGPVYLFPTFGGLLEIQPAQFFSSFNTQPGTLLSFYLKNASVSPAVITITNSAGQVMGKPIEIKQPVAGLNTVSMRAEGVITAPGEYKVILQIDGKQYNQTLHAEDVSDEVICGAK